MSLGKTILLLALVVAAAAPARAQAPGAEYLQLRTAHFRITYQEGLEPLARRAAARAETAYAQIITDLSPPPSGTIDITIIDDVDYANGFATPIPSNRVVIFAKPPMDLPGLENFSDWFELVLTHELTHIFHLDRAPRLGRALRSVFGRVPFAWPFFPVIAAPGWAVEGVAVVEESRLTGQGRAAGSYHEMVMRTAILEDRFDPLDRASNYSPIFPGGERAYMYGSMFLDFIGRRYGADVQRKIVNRTVDAKPFIQGFDKVAQRAVGKKFTTLYAEWRDSLKLEYAALADSIRAAGTTSTDVITPTGYYALRPRLSPDGSQLAYVGEDGRNSRMIHVRDLASGADRKVTLANNTYTAAWVPDGSALITTRLQWKDPDRARADLYRVALDGSVQRLTRDARIENPDVARDGRRVVVTQTERGTVSIAIVDAHTGAIRRITAPSLDTLYAFPRWSPDGTRIAASRWTSGGFYDVVVLDTMGTVLRELAHDRAVDTEPAWTPDGFWVLFSSDRTGIPNIFAAAAAGEDRTVQQVTNVLTGAFAPEVSRDGRGLYFVAYHADGYHIERTALDPAGWRRAAAPPLTAVNEARDTMFAVRQRGLSQGMRIDTTVTSGPTSYSALHSLLPRFWIPVGFGDDVVGTFLGLTTAGVDLIGRHSYGLTAQYSVDKKKAVGYFNYTYSGLTNPALHFTLVRDWSNASFTRAGAVHEATEREDVAALGASFSFPRAFRSASANISVEKSARRTFVTDTFRLADPDDDFVGAVGSVSFNTSRRPLLAISREDGISVQLTGRRRWDIDTSPALNAAYSEGIATGSAYRSLALPGFAHHVIALRGAGRVRSGNGAEAFDIGGANGTSTDPLGLLANSVGTARTLPVRGFSPGARRGTQGWSVSAEYRAPIANVGRSLIGLRSLYVDRVSAALFINAGNAWCTGSPTRYNTRCRALVTPAGTLGEFLRQPTLVGTGAELSVDMGPLGLPTVRVRGGVGFPVAGLNSHKPIAYVQVGPSF